jgi:drug/metabolite transporter (DMT)-like permease
VEEVHSNRAALARELALLLLLATLWGASYSFIKVGVATIPPIILIALRTLIAGLLLLLIMRWRAISMPTDMASWGRFAFQAYLNSVIPWTLIAWAERSVDAGLATILNSAAPIFTFLFTALVTRHEASTPRKLFGVVAGMAGICLIVGMKAFDHVGQELLGEVAIVAATLCYAGGAIFSRGFAGLDPMAPAAGSLLCGTVVLIPFGLVVEQP